MVKQILLVFLTLITTSLKAGAPIDIKQLPIQEEVYLVAVDVSLNPTNMPNMMLWDLPIMLLYRQVDNFDNIDVNQIRSDIEADWVSGNYQPVVIRANKDQSLRLHLMNLIGTGDAPERLVQGVVCKSCKKRAYTFSYGEAAERSKFPWLASLHAHGIQYKIEHDGTRSGMNVANNPAADGLVAPGETRTYVYDKLDLPGVWPIHDHANPSHTVSRGLHLALVVEDPHSRDRPDHDFLIMFSDYPEYEEYLDEFYAQTFVPPFLHMRNGNVMHAHALNGYATMIPPRMNMAVGGGNTMWDALRTDILPTPRTPTFEVEQGKLIRFRLLSFGATTTHSFHIHGHAWWDQRDRKYRDSVAIPAGDSEDIMFYAGGPPYKAGAVRTLPYEGINEETEVPVRSGTGDWLYHCHVIPHVKHGMWGIFRVVEPGSGDGNSGEER